MDKKKIIIGGICIVLVLFVGIVIGNTVHITIEPNESKQTSGKEEQDNKEENAQEKKNADITEEVGQQKEQETDKEDNGNSGSVIIKEDSEPEVANKEDNTVYFAKSQFKPNSFGEIADYTKIYDDEDGKNYKAGEYPEIDEAVEVIRQYLNGETDYYAQLVKPGKGSQHPEEFYQLADEEIYKDRDKALLLLQTQFEFEPGTKVDFVINRVEYQGISMAYQVGASLMIKYSAYPQGSENGFWDLMSIHVYNIDGKWYYEIF